MLVIDGSQGEGGGQVLRTCLSLAAITGRPFRLERIRAKRSTPGLRPQHLTGVRAVAAICQARVQGDQIGSQTLTFEPTRPPLGGKYTFDVTEAAGGGSAGAVTLIIQAILWPLLFADRPTDVTLRGGTFVPFSPPFHYLDKVARPAYERFGARLTLDLVAWGWYPAGGGEVQLHTVPLSQLDAVRFQAGKGAEIDGVAAVTNLPAHIPDRMARRADNLLRKLGLRPNVRAVRERAQNPGAGIVLWCPQAGASALGRQGLPAEEVAETAVAELAAFVENRVAVDLHLADQLTLPMALAHGESTFTTNRLTLHTLTNAALLRQWLDIPVTITGELDTPGAASIRGAELKNPA